MTAYETTTCPVCGGKGKTSPAMTLDLKSEREQAEYEEMINRMQVDCWNCDGTGVIQDLKQ